MQSQIRGYYRTGLGDTCIMKHRTMVGDGAQSMTNAWSNCGCQSVWFQHTCRDDSGTYQRGEIRVILETQFLTIRWRQWAFRLWSVFDKRAQGQLGARAPLLVTGNRTSCLADISVGSNNGSGNTVRYILINWTHYYFEILCSDRNT